MGTDWRVEERLREKLALLSQELSKTLAALDAVRADLAAAEKAREEAERERDEAKQAHEGACRLVAKMHHAATGSVTGPIRGVIEDVADISARLADAESRAARLAEALRAIAEDECHQTTRDVGAHLETCSEERPGDNSRWCAVCIARAALGEEGK